MTVACLPSLLEPVDGADCVVWDGEGDGPPRADEIELLVPPPRYGDVGLFARLPRLKVVQTVSAGVDRYVGHVPDGVTLCNARGVHGGAVGEWALAVTLAALRALPRFLRAQDDHDWATSDTDELAGKRVLVVGAGDLGDHVARRFAACDAEITLVAHSARDGVHATDELPDLLPAADVAVVLVPLTADTTGMVDAAFLAALPDGALVVNAARGPVVDTDALLAELQSGRLRAALDVTDPEPLPADHPLWDAPNVLITPHVAGDVPGFPARAQALVEAQLRRLDRGEPLANVVSGAY